MVPESRFPSRYVAKESQIEPQTTTLMTKISASNSQYGRAVSRIAVTQILESTGFEHSYKRPIDALADVMIRYISHVGKLSVSYCNMSNRSNCNAFDVIHALEEIESVQGFTDQSDPNSVVIDLYRFVTKKEVPFAGSITRFPVTRDRKVEILPDAGKDEVVGGHVPGWLPPFPDPITYNNCSVSTGFVPGQPRDMPHFSFGKFFSLNGLDGFAPIGRTNVERENEAGQRNPFLVPPLPHGERHVSDMTIPGERKGISVIETFAPVLEGSGEEIIEERGAISSNKRPVIRFRIGVDSKSMSKVVSLRDTGLKVDTWTVKEEEMDSKKRRAEMILKESMEKPNELAQL
ncbi:transcription initiation factor TFIID subunit 8 [Carex littledalei]|uniref:Transcription initiation factor TFIID subunit 8 n=1 Tax=Carex littledalei TaxID=544730 RepID=A0A833RPV9_9POAL|nr:transcription initiation factor TFIID subunit 8 [Carex littledalei]